MGDFPWSNGKLETLAFKVVGKQHAGWNILWGVKSQTFIYSWSNEKTLALVLSLEGVGCSTQADCVFLSAVNSNISSGLLSPTPYSVPETYDIVIYIVYIRSSWTERFPLRLLKSKTSNPFPRGLRLKYKCVRLDIPDILDLTASAHLLTQFLSKPQYKRMK